MFGRYLSRLQDDEIGLRVFGTAIETDHGPGGALDRELQKDMGYLLCRPVTLCYHLVEHPGNEGQQRSPIVDVGKNLSLHLEVRVRRLLELGHIFRDVREYGL